MHQGMYWRPILPKKAEPKKWKEVKAPFFYSCPAEEYPSALPESAVTLHCTQILLPKAGPRSSVQPSHPLSDQLPLPIRNIIEREIRQVLKWWLVRAVLR